MGCSFESCEQMIHTPGNFCIPKFLEKVVKFVEVWLQVVAVTELFKLWRKQASCNWYNSQHTERKMIGNKTRAYGK